MGMVAKVAKNSSHKQKPVKSVDKRHLTQGLLDTTPVSGESPNPLIIEIPKILLSNNLEYIRGTLQTLQSLTSILLTAYIALLVGFRKDVGLQNELTLLVAFLPILCWGSSLFWGFISAAVYLKSKNEFRFGNLESTVTAYEEVLRRRRKQILLPAILSFLGLICFVISFFVVFLPTLARPAG